MKNKLIVNTLLAFACISSTSCFAAQSAEQMIQDMQTHATKPEYIPKSRSVVMFGKQTKEAVVVLENPRWVVKGQLYDMWSNTEIVGISELHEASKKIPLNRINIDLNRALTIRTNTTKPMTLTVFIDPFKETAMKDIETLLKYANGYQLNFVLFTKDRGENSVKRLFSLACDIQGKSINKQLAILMNQSTQIKDVACSKEQVIASYGSASILGIVRSPTLISSTFVASEGFPKNLTKWLLENMK